MLTIKAPLLKVKLFDLIFRDLLDLVGNLVEEKCILTDCGI